MLEAYMVAKYDYGGYWKGAEWYGAAEVWNPSASSGTTSSWENPATFGLADDWWYPDAQTGEAGEEEY